MIIVIIIFVVIITCFGGVLFAGAPYLPTLKPQIKAALEIASLKPGQTLLELGCGDGKVLVAAAKSGCRVVGFELNPILAFIAWARTRRYGKNVQVICGNFWRQKLPDSDVIYVFLLQRYMEKLDTKLTQELTKPVKVISFAFSFPDRKTLLEKKGLFIYDFKPHRSRI